MTENFLKNRRLVVIIILGFLLRVVFYFAAVSHYRENLIPSLASDGYYQIAQYFAGSPEIPADSSVISVRTPGYPLLMAPFVAANLLGIFILIQISISSLIPWLGYLLSRRIFPDNQKIAYFTAAALAVEPLSVMLASQLLTETFFVFFFLLLVLQIINFLRSSKENLLKEILILGALSGIGALIRPNLIYFPFVVVVLIAYKFLAKEKKGRNVWKKIICQTTIFISVFFVFMAPWMYRNYRIHGNWSLTSAGSNLGILALAPSAVALERNISYADAQRVVLKEIKLSEQPNVSVSEEQRYNQIILKILRENKKGFVLSLLASNFQLWTHDGYLTVFQFLGIFSAYETSKLATPPLFTMLTHPREIPLGVLLSYLTKPVAIIVFSRLLWIALFIAALTGLILNAKKEGWLFPHSFSLLLILAYFSITSMILGLGITARVRQPVNALIFILAGYALCSFSKKFKKV